MLILPRLCQRPSTDITLCSLSKGLDAGVGEDKSGEGMKAELPPCR